MQFVVEFRSMSTVSTNFPRRKLHESRRLDRNVLNFKVCDNLCARLVCVPDFVP